MRLRQRDLKEYSAKPRVVSKDNDGTTYEDWGHPLIIKANVQPSGGKIMSEIYGERLAYMLIAYVEDIESLKEGDGFYIQAPLDDVPDYKIAAILPWFSHKVLHLEKVIT